MEASRYVITDQLNPENEGKDFLFKYGKKIFDKLNDVMNPAFPDQEPMNPFDLWAGANFKLKIRNLEGYRNYDKSEFAAPLPLSNDDEEMEKIWKQTHSLKAFLDPSNFKSYDELKAKLHKVLGLDGSTVGYTPEVARKKAEDVELPWQQTEQAPAFKEKPAVKQSSEDEDEDMEEFFAKLNK